MTIRLLAAAAVLMLGACGPASAELEPETLDATENELRSECAAIGLAGSPGDYELTVDPQDSTRNGLFLFNQGSNVLVARVNGLSGLLASGAPEIIATTYTGSPVINGPEFALLPSGRMGILFAGPAGVHGAFRPQGAAWSAFTVDVNGANFALDAPPPLVGTQSGNYPAGGPPFGVATYSAVALGGSCEVGCVGEIGAGTTTDIAVVAAALNIDVTSATPHPKDTGVVFFSGCTSTAPVSCGIWSAHIDRAGGFAPGTVKSLTTAAQGANFEALRAAVHPSSAKTVVYAQNGFNIDVYEQSSAESVLVKVQSIAFATNTFGHFRVEAGAGVLVLYFTQEGAGQNSGTFSIVTDAGMFTSPVKKLANAPRMVELVFLPRASRWATYSPSVGESVQRCWVTP